MTTRRTVLRAGGIAGWAMLAGAGCAPGGRATQIACAWSGDELERFRAVLRGYPHPVEVISAGDDIDAFLRARHLAGTSPDVAILSWPGLVTEYARRGWLSSVDPALAVPFPQDGSDLLWVDGQLYGVWVKAAFKSLFWYSPSIVDFPPPGTWEELTAVVRRMGRDASSRPRPLAIGAADGWVLTDWLENVLTAVAKPDFYEALADGQPRWSEAPVKDALNLLAELWSLPGAFVGGPQRALLTQFDESVVQVTSGRAAMVFEADFAQAIVSIFREPGFPAPTTFPFPRVENVAPLVVGGDAAVVLRGSRHGEDLLRYLVDPQAFDPWISAGGYLSPHLGVSPDRYPDPLQRRLAQAMVEAAARQELRFDLSDRLTGTFGGADGVGIWQILQDYFRAVTARRADVSRALGVTVGRLDRAASRAGGTP